MKDLEKMTPQAAYEYALNVIKGRWPEAETSIMTSPEWAYWYAFSVIRGRWLEAEATIKTDPKFASWYAYDVIEGRWPEAEAEVVIKTDADWFDKYCKNVLKM